MTRKELDGMTYHIIGSAIRVHRQLGPGLLESVYQKFLKEDLIECGFKVMTEHPINLKHAGGETFSANLRCDILINDVIIIEVKSVIKILPIHEAQLLSYMRLLRKPKGILINFNCVNIFKYGQKTFVNEIYSRLAAS